jgi:hypothetical protein
LILANPNYKQHQLIAEKPIQTKSQKHNKVKLTQQMKKQRQKEPMSDLKNIVPHLSFIAHRNLNQNHRKETIFPILKIIIIKFVNRFNLLKPNPKTT